MAKMRYCIAQPAPKKTSNIQMRWSVQDPLSPMLWSTTNSLPVYTYGKNICWCIHSVVPHLGIVKESILNTNKPGAVFLVFFFFFFDAQNCLNMFASTAHHAIHRWKMFPSQKSIASPLWVCHWSTLLPPFSPGTPGTGNRYVNMSEHSPYHRIAAHRPIVLRGWNSLSLSIYKKNMNACSHIFVLIHVCHVCHK